MAAILPGTIPYPKDKLLYLSLEASEPCTILIEILQNYKDGKIQPPLKNKVAKPSFTKDDEKSALIVHNTPGAALTIDQLLKVRKNNVTPPNRTPFDNAKLYSEKIKSMICLEKEVDLFHMTYKQIKANKQEEDLAASPDFPRENYLETNKGTAAVCRGERLQRSIEGFQLDKLKHEEAAERRVGLEEDAERKLYLCTQRRAIRQGHRQQVFEIMW